MNAHQGRAWSRGDGSGGLLVWSLERWRKKKGWQWGGHLGQSELGYQMGALCKLPSAQFPRLRRSVLSLYRGQENTVMIEISLSGHGGWPPASLLLKGNNSCHFSHPQHWTPNFTYIRYHVAGVTHISKGDKDEEDELHAGVQTSLCIPSGGWHWVTPHRPHMGIRMKYRE